METVVLASGRRYLAARPAVGEPPWPVVVMLHGTGGSAEFAADETRLVPFASDAGFVVAFGDGLPVKPGEPPRFLSNPQRWNDGSTSHGDSFHTDTDDVGYLADLIADVLARTNGDPTRVYLTGFSNGASMAFRFAAERSELLAAVAPVAGYCPASVPTPARPVSTRFIVGDADLLIPAEGGPVRLPWGNRTVTRPPIRETVLRWAGRIRAGSVSDGLQESVAHASGSDKFGSAGASPSRSSVTEIQFAAPAGCEFTWVTVHGLGHHWPGGKGQFNPRLAGPTSDELDANAEIWSFFRRHRLE